MDNNILPSGQSPFFTVVLPTYNGIFCVENAINSILAQHFCSFELLVIDDCSVDGTDSLLKKFTDKRIKVISNKKNLGLAASLNKATVIANGKWLVRADDDDISYPERLSTLKEYIENEPEVGVFGSSAVLMDYESGCLKKLDVLEKHEVIKAALPYKNPLIHPSVAIERNIALQNPYCEYLRRKQDYELWSRLITVTKFRNINIPLIQYSYRNKLSIKEILSSFLVQMIVSIRLNSLKGLLFSAVVAFKNVAHLVGIYKPKYLRTRRK